jgi:hypothetical protein
MTRFLRPAICKLRSVYANSKTIVTSIKCTVQKAVHCNCGVCADVFATGDVLNTKRSAWQRSTNSRVLFRSRAEASVARTVE